ncbi:MAG: transporter [Acidibrevibacterium sp.]|uniref:transporter n=1 Tax=Acidibrevibacterium sp. TaxID=2606776 RepID=UPI003CFBD4C7
MPAKSLGWAWWRAPLTLGTIVAIVILACAAPARAQITFPSASPISAGNIVIRAQPTATEESGGVQSLYGEGVVLYGASPDLTFILENKSIVSNSAELFAHGQMQEMNATGFGDTVLDTRYIVYENDGVGSTFRIAPYFGIDIPTGMQNTNAFVPRELQPASGDWGTREALTSSWNTLFWNAQALIGYQNYASSGGYQAGGGLLADAAFHYLVWPGDLDREVPAEIFASLEANYTLYTPDRFQGENVSGTGGQLLTVDPGFIYSRPDWGFALTALLPVLQQTRGIGGARYDYGFEAAFRINFFTYHHW